MNVPSMYNVAEMMVKSSYTEEQVFDAGIAGAIVFLVVVPELGACRVPDAALSDFMAGVDEFSADKMPEHYSGALSGRWTIKRERLRILADSWSAWERVGNDLVTAGAGSDRVVKGELAAQIAGEPPMHEGRPLAVVYAEQEQRKRDAGRYTLEEAAAVIECEAGERKDGIVEKLRAAVRARSLPVYEPGKHARYELLPGTDVRTFYVEAFWDDLNRWLHDKEPRIAYRFPDPAPSAQSPRMLIESVGHRNARWLTMFDMEVRITARGAQARTVSQIVKGEGVTGSTAKRGIQDAKKQRLERLRDGDVKPRRTVRNTAADPFAMVRTKGNASR